MNAPIRDFAARYAAAGTSRLHMPGHKGAGPIGCEAYDITEIAGADELYAASGIIAESEANAAALFGTGATFYSTEGSSLCVRAMLYMALVRRPKALRALAAREALRRPKAPVALAARNAHKALLYAAALCDFDIEWLYPESRTDSLCACPVTAAGLARRLDAMPEPPFCVCVTSPDYLGGMQDVAGLAAVCHRREVPLIVDNAHGAYLKFLPESLHPMDLGADLCCDSAHKTLPVLTGGAYLHISKAARDLFAPQAREALALFGSTSPSYLILQSLDACNPRLAGDWPERLRECAAKVAALRATLTARGYDVIGDEPVKLTLRGDGLRMAEALRRGGVECEYADGEHVVLMFAPDNPDRDYRRVSEALVKAPPRAEVPPLTLPRLRRAVGIRRAMFAPWEEVPVGEAVGRVCAAPAVSCPPAVPVAVSGEVIDAAAVAVFERYGIRSVKVLQEPKLL